MLFARSVCTTTCDPPLIQGVGTHLHGSNLCAPVQGFGQLGLKLIRHCRGVGGGHALPRPAIDQGSKQRGRTTTLKTEMLDQMGCGGLAVGACHTNEMHPGRRMLPERCSQRTGPVGQRLGDHQHRILARGGFQPRCLRPNQGGHRPSLQGLLPKTASIHSLTGKPDEQTAL